MADSPSGTDLTFVTDSLSAVDSTAETDRSFYVLNLTTNDLNHDTLGNYILGMLFSDMAGMQVILNESLIRFRI